MKLLIFNLNQKKTLKKKKTVQQQFYSTASLEDPLKNSSSSSRNSSSASGGNNNNTTITLLGQSYPLDAISNISPAIASKLNRNLLFTPNHPLSILKKRIEMFFNGSQHSLQKLDPLAPKTYTVLDSLSPIVSTHQNFDSLLVPEDHVSRSRNDTYYVNKTTVLRCHTSAHQVDAMRKGLTSILISGDVYRRDEIDSSHYPAFHQMEGIRLFSDAELKSANPEYSEMFSQSNESSSSSSSSSPEEQKKKQQAHNQLAVSIVEKDLKFVLEHLAKHLFGADTPIRWVDAYFPFTHPSWEMEVFFQNKWMEILGCGVIQQPIVKAAGKYIYLYYD